VDAIAWSPKKNVLASLGDSGTIMLWDVANLQPHQQTSSPIAKLQSNGSNMLVWSPDGSMIAVGGAYTKNNDFNSSALYVYKGDLSDVVPGFPVAATGSNLINGLAWVQNKYVAIVNTPLDYIDKNQVQLIVVDPTNPKLQIAPLAVNVGLLALGMSKTQGIVASPDSTQLAICTDYGLALGQPQIAGQTLKWQASTKNLLTFNSEKLLNEVDAASWAPNGKTVIALDAGTSPGSTIVGWHWQDSNPQAMFLVSQGVALKLTTLAWCPAPTSSLIAAGSTKQDGSVYIWDITKNRTPVRTLTSGIKADVVDLVWSSDGAWLAANYADTNASTLIWKMR
ncbi:MAG TPA: WD40 repeat domain-containing protein, partial [Ktedonobacteraceae bacterium]|nr:WD40 repeat domain-containing protein [Ktedonobacteraceae bacterium]